MDIVFGAGGVICGRWWFRQAKGGQHDFWDRLAALPKPIAWEPMARTYDFESIFVFCAKTGGLSKVRLFCRYCRRSYTHFMLKLAYQF